MDSINGDIYEDSGNHLTYTDISNLKF
jgi:hypothetical protein